MEAKITQNSDGTSSITITAQLESAPKPSSTGKSLLLVTTSGFFKPGIMHAGKPVSVSLNVIIPTK